MPWCQEKATKMSTSDVMKMLLINQRNLKETGISKMFSLLIEYQYLYLPMCNSGCNLSYNFVLNMFNGDKSKFLENLELKTILVTVWFASK